MKHGNKYQARLAMKMIVIQLFVIALIWLSACYFREASWLALSVVFIITLIPSILIYFDEKSSI